MNKMITVAAFALGAAAGSVATWQILKNKYEQRYQEERTSMIEALSRVSGNTETKDNKEEPKLNILEHSTGVAYGKVAVEEYVSTLNDNEYTNVEAEDVEDGCDAPYVIAPEEFGEKEEYSQISLTYYSDGTLADDDDKIVYDIDNIVGSDSLTHFGEFEEDAVHVCNERLKTYFEILVDQRKYSEVLKKEPYKADV